MFSAVNPIVVVVVLRVVVVDAAVVVMIIGKLTKMHCASFSISKLSILLFYNFTLTMQMICLYEIYLEICI